MFQLKKLITALILPPAGPLLVALLGLYWARRRRRAGTAVAVAALALLIAGSLPLVGDGLLRSLETLPPIRADQLRSAQAIVVLGGGTYRAAPEYGGDTANRNTLLRLRYAAVLQRRSGLPLLVSGGAPFGGLAEAEAMRTVLETEFAVPVRWVEAASADTAENAANSARLLRAAGVQRIALVSQAWHLPRAVALFERQGLTVMAAPTGFSTPSPSLLEDLLPSAVALEHSRTALHEWLGRLL